MCLINNNPAINNNNLIGNQGPFGGNNRPGNTMGQVGNQFGGQFGGANLQNPQTLMNLLNMLVQLIQGLQQGQTQNPQHQAPQAQPALQHGGNNQNPAGTRPPQMFGQNPAMGGNPAQMFTQNPAFTGNPAQMFDAPQQQQAPQFGAPQQQAPQFGALPIQNNNPFVNNFAAPGPNGFVGQNGPMGGNHKPLFNNQAPVMHNGHQHNQVANNPANLHGQAHIDQNVNVGVNNGVINQIIIINGDVNGQIPGLPVLNHKPGFNPMPVNHQPLAPVAIKNDAAKIWGDPHFVGAEGGKYDVQGEAGKTYNILSDKGLQVNSTFAKYGGGGATVMGQVGVTLGHNQLEIDKTGALKVNGEAVKDGTYLDGAVEKKGKNVIIKDGEYDLTVKSAGTYLNIDFGSDNVAADGVMPHGLWGQSADGDGKARNGDKGAGAQGGGAIEGADGNISKKGDKETVKLYEVNGLFDTNFQNFNKFHTQFETVARPVAAQGNAEDAIAK